MPVLYLTEQGATLRKEGDLLLVTKEGQQLQKIPAVKVEQVVVLGNINLTTPAITYLLQQGIDCVFCNSYGKYHGRLLSTESRFGLLRQRQLQRLKTKLCRVVKPDDSLRYYHLCGQCLPKFEVVNGPPVEKAQLYFVV